MAKRLLDIFLSSLGLFVFSPIFLVCAVIIKIDSPGPALFRQIRLGLGFRPFTLYKFRSMLDEPGQSHFRLAGSADPRITRVGRILRKTKFDELPQLINVLKGEMSLVGPRPEVPQYVELFRREYEEMLKVRPGITDLASLKYNDEATILGFTENPEDVYIHQILPDKINLSKRYVR